ncbi:MAG: ferritin-like fold-containing protein [Microbacteriaceae bacterium]
MIFGFSKAQKNAPAPKLRSRSQSRTTEALAGESLDHLAMNWNELTARSSYFELKLFTLLSNGVEQAPDLVLSEGLSLAAAHALRAHHDLAAELIRGGEDPVLQMQEFTKDYDEFFTRVHTDSWVELVLTAYLVGGLLGDFTRHILDAQDPRNDTLVTALNGRADSPVVREVLMQILESSPGQADRLALWGRRLVGDVLLLCRETFRELLSDSGVASAPLQASLTAIIAEHTRRMDSLGLTA